MQAAIEKVANGQDLTEYEAKDVMDCLLSGRATQAQIGAFLTALRMKGETVDELTGFASVLKEKAGTISPKCMNYVDFVGTGGDRTFTFNISTTGAFVAAGAGVHIAKHGNRSISSKSGAGDVLEALGVNIMADPAIVERCVDEAGIGFMFAPSFNRSMRFVGQARKEMGIRTVFNILGPLANPSRAKGMLVGVYTPEMTEKMAMVMARLGVERAFVISGRDHMDEFTTTDVTVISEIKDGQVRTFEAAPEEFGFERAALEELKGGDGAENARITRAILRGEKGAKRDIVVLNAGAAIYIAGAADSVREGIRMAKEAIDSGRAMQALTNLVRVSNQ
ncbi:MAG: anthranilate phosphoribosyltransferase [Eubacterium sp.]|jgi:anthranilate phosphoribosyltransferase|nr:anthranilate phosphoribosyltransferase [Eubacterium sp.]NBI84846.1 anthranilate phosphoribosyltransferase [Lachnospiraceae bacterium]